VRETRAMPRPSKSRIVSSSHLVAEDAAETSELEYGLFVATNAFNRWIVRCMAAAGVADLGALDVMVLHTVNHRDRPKKLADICFTLNIEDTHTVNYALKKLAKQGLVDAERQGKERLYETSAEGRAACDRYREVRDACLIETLTALGSVDTEEIGDAARVLRALSGLYDQAARAATSL
jgi:predicted MarR family transcription regulator